MPLIAAHPLALAQLPSSPGFYRLRRTDRPHQLEWIGWAEQGVREAVERLSRQVHLQVEPYDDPVHPAVRLWSARQSARAGFDVSGAPLPSASHDGPALVRRLRAAYSETGDIGPGGPSGVK